MKSRILASIVFLASMVASTAYAQPCVTDFGNFQPLAPNRQMVIEQLIQRYPLEWAALNDLTHGEDLRFIKRAAWALYNGDASILIDHDSNSETALVPLQGDPAWGLNGKRGTTEISADVLTRLNSTVNFTERPDLAGSEAFDIIVGHGSPSARAGWQPITCEYGSGSLWIRPESVGGGAPVPPTQPPTQPPPPPPSQDIEELRRRIAATETLIIEIGATDEKRAAELQAQVNVLKGQVAQLAAGFKQHQEQVEGYKNAVQKYLLKYILPIVGGIFGIAGMSN